MPEPTDKTPAKQIRDEYVEVIARAFYEAEAADDLATTGEKRPPWDQFDKSSSGSAVGDARLAVDALIAAGLPRPHAGYEPVEAFMYLISLDADTFHAAMGEAIDRVRTTEEPAAAGQIRWWPRWLHFGTSAERAE